MGFLGWSATSSTPEVIEQLQAASQDREVYVSVPTSPFDSRLLQLIQDAESHSFSNGAVAAETLYSLLVHYCSHPTLQIQWRIAELSLFDEDVQSAPIPSNAAVAQLRAMVHSNPEGVLQRWQAPEQVFEEVAHDPALAKELQEEGQKEPIDFSEEFEDLLDPLAAAASPEGCYIACQDTGDYDGTASRSIQLNFRVCNAFHFTCCDAIRAVNKDTNTRNMAPLEAVHAI